jgi:hypothetical protein
MVLADRFNLCWEVIASPCVPQDLLGLTLQIVPQQVAPLQGYELVITAEAITISAHDEPGAFYGVCTLIQIMEQAAQQNAGFVQEGVQLPCLQIEDWPDFSVRGVMLDISRDKVPSMENLYSLVDKLASWKINHLQLYTEHTFAYRNHPEVWTTASPLTGQEILDLDQYCHQRYIELVPNQNSFGHLSRWLALPRYKPLAEIVEGYDMPWGHHEGSFSLCPIDPASLEFISGLYDELLPHFTSRQVNVGCDETFDIGQGRSRQACEELGTGRVYLDFLLKIYRQIKARNHVMQFWGDIIVHYPELISKLPKDMIALEWGYEARHPFDEHGKQFAEAGLPFYVCPGTSSWCSLAGRTNNALGNLRNAAENGLRYGAQGYLITDWGDNGHWQPLPVSYLGFAAGAGYAWALEANCEVDVALIVSHYAFGDPTGKMGRVAYDLGNVYEAYGLDWENSSILFGTLQAPLERIRKYKNVSSEGYHRALEAIDQAMLPLDQAFPSGPDKELVVQEYRLIARMLRHACRRG